MITRERLETLLATFSKLAVGLVGDLFLDRYLHIAPEVCEYSRETGLEAYQIARIRNQPGALGTVLSNLLALGVGHVQPVSVIGQDGHGDDLLRELQRQAVSTRDVLRSADRWTPTYIKPLKPEPGGGLVELHRLDVRSREPLPPELRAALGDRIRQVFVETEGLIVLDQLDQQNEGVVHDQVRECLRSLARERPDKLIFVDSRRGLDRFDFGILKGNQDEILGAVRGEPDLLRAASRLAARTARPVFCTRGAAGILIAHPDGQHEHAPAGPVSGPLDIVGAGDSATSGIVLALLAGASPYEAAVVGNLAASITVQQLGTTGTASGSQILDRWHATCV